MSKFYSAFLSKIFSLLLLSNLNATASNQRYIEIEVDPVSDQKKIIGLLTPEQLEEPLLPNRERHIFGSKVEVILVDSFEIPSRESPEYLSNRYIEIEIYENGRDRLVRELSAAQLKEPLAENRKRYPLKLKAST